MVASTQLPHPVADEEIEALQAIVISGLRAEPRSYLNVGRRVRIEIGPLAGVEDRVTTLKSTNRLVVSVHLLQRSVSVEINGSWVLTASPVVPLSRRQEQQALVIRQ